MTGAEGDGPATVDRERASAERRGRPPTAERLALPAVAAATAVLLVIVFYYPIGTVLVEAVPPVGLAEQPLVEVATSEFLLVEIVGFTAYQAALSTVASVALGLPGAYVLSRFEFPGRATLRSLTMVPFVLPSIMVAVGFVATFGSGGTLPTLLSALGLQPVSPLYSLPAIVVAHAFYNAPLVARTTTAAWESVDARAVESARSLGAGPQRAFLDVVAPQLLPAVLVGATLTFVFTFASFPIVLALGGLEYATVEVWIFRAVRNLDYGRAAALAVVESGVSLSLTYAYLRYEARSETRSRGANPLARKSLVPSSPSVGETAVRVGVGVYAVVVAVVFLAPLASMVLASVTGPDGQFTLSAYRFLLERQRTGASFQVKPLPAVRNSLLFAAGTLALSLPMGVVLSVLTTREYRGRKLVDALTMAPLAVSGIVVGLGTLRGLVFGVTLFGYRLSVVGPVAVVAAHAVGAYPFVVRNVAPLLGDLDRSLTESARALGASRLRALWDVELPLVWPGVVAGAAFAVAISIGEFDATVVLASGSGQYTMPVALQRYIGRRLGPATAMGCVLLAVTAGSFVVIERFGGRVE
ncbi:MAG: ABC transporter permease [Halolamina sp.]